MQIPVLRTTLVETYWNIDESTAVAAQSAKINLFIWIQHIEAT